MIDSNKEEFKQQVNSEGEELNVKIVTMNVKKSWKFAWSFHPNRTGKWAAEKRHKQLIELKETMVEMFFSSNKKEKIKGRQKIITIWGQSITPLLLALEKKEPKLYKI